MRSRAALVEPPPVGWAATVRHVAGIGLAGLVTGVLVGGLGSRLFMRIAGAAGRDLAQGRLTEAGFRVGEITAGGTIALVVFVGIFSGILAAALYVILGPWIRWAGPWRGLVFGVVLFAVGSASSDVLNPDNVDFFILGNDVVNVAAIVALFLVFGLVFGWIHRGMATRLGSGSTSAAAHAAITGLGVLFGLPLLVATLFTDSGCHCGPSPWIAWSVVIAGVGTVGWWLAARWEALRSASMVLGFGGLLGSVGFGLVRAVSDATEILG